MSEPVVAIVGRPNVGKSTLFNKLAGQRLSIVDDTPGVTRDRIYAECEWCGRTFSIVDTGGIESSPSDEILSQTRMQAELAIDTADVIVLVTDIHCGVVAEDMDIASMLLKSGKPVIPCVNKCDSIGDPPPEFYEFYNLGLGDPVCVSSVHGHGTGDLLDMVVKQLPPVEDSDKTTDDIKIAVIGKPNVGKSSLINKIVGEERCIVSNVAGTTRDAIDISVENEYGRFTLTDTAGLRKKSRITDSIEKYSMLRAQMAVERSDVCIIMLDAIEGFTEQDSKVAGLAHESGKGCVIAVNKWDAIEKSGETMQAYEKSLKNDFSFMSYARIIFISVKTGQRLGELFKAVSEAAKFNAMRISTGTLNDVLAQAVARVQPPTDKGRRLKIYYMTQTGAKPPTFVFFVNSHKLFHFSYQRYLENTVRDTFGFTGTPIRIVVRERGEINKHAGPF